GKGIGLAEFLEQLLLLLRRHADTGIRYGELDPAASVGHLASTQPALALFGELAGIAQQVEQYLPQPHGIHGQWAEALLTLDDQAILVLLGKLARRADDLVDQRDQVDQLRMQLELASFDLREVEHLIDEAKEVLAGAVHALQRLLRFFCAKACRVANHHLGQTDDGVERRSQLVRHVRERSEERRVG